MQRVGSTSAQRQQRSVQSTVVLAAVRNDTGISPRSSPVENYWCWFTSRVLPIVKQPLTRMRLTKFCCTSLRRGTIFIGFTSVVSSAFSITSIITITKDLPASNETVVLMRMMTFATVIFLAGSGILGGLMIRGALAGKPELIFPWLALSTTDLLVTISIILSFLLIAPLFIPFAYFVGCLVIIVVLLALHTYIWFAIYSFYMQLMIEKYAVRVAPEYSKDMSPPMIKSHNV